MLTQLDKSTISILFGKRVRLLRSQAGLSQEKFAEVCGLDCNYISRIERGMRNPTLEVINVIAHRLKIDLATLFEL